MSTIFAKEAKVKTASVEIKALTIAGKQVTLAVFRQLKKEDVLDEDGELKGEPWGIVNYFFKGCAYDSPHLHVVWQKEAELRRACLWNEPRREPKWRNLRTRLQDHFDFFITTSLLQRTLPPTVTFHGSTYVQNASAVMGTWFGSITSPLSDAESKVVAELKRNRQRFKRYNPTSGHEEYIETEQEFAVRNEEGWQAVYVPLKTEWDENWWEGRSDDPAEWWTQFQHDRSIMLGFEQRWREQYAMLAEIDHLFIAV